MALLLSNSQPTLAAWVSKALEDLEIECLAPLDQFQKLIQQPLQELNHDVPLVIIVLDGLDQCTSCQIFLSMIHLFASLPQIIKFVIMS
jgi:hypothetical protein